MDPFWPLSMMQGGEAAPGYAPHHLPHHPTMPVDLHVTQPHYQYYRWAPSLPKYYLSGHLLVHTCLNLCTRLLR